MSLFRQAQNTAWRAKQSGKKVYRANLLKEWRILTRHFPNRIHAVIISIPAAYTLRQAAAFPNAVLAQENFKGIGEHV